MIRAIGLQRFLILILLAGLTIFLLFVGSFTLKPDLENKQVELNRYRAEISEMTANIDQLASGMEQFEQQKSTFERVQGLGFFDPQNRQETRQRISAMQKESRLISAKFNIKPAVAEPNEKAKEAGYKIINTDMDFTLEAVEDSDIYNFVYLLNYGFPGQILIKEFGVHRDKEITQELIRKIGVEDPDPVVVVGRLVVNWRTMVPDQSLAISIDTGEDN